MVIFFTTHSQSVFEMCHQSKLFKIGTFLLHVWFNLKDDISVNDCIKTASLPKTISNQNVWKNAIQLNRSQCGRKSKLKWENSDGISPLLSVTERKNRNHGAGGKTVEDYFNLSTSFCLLSLFGTKPKCLAETLLLAAWWWRPVWKSFSHIASVNHAHSSVLLTSLQYVYSHPFVLN